MNAATIEMARQIQRVFEEAAADPEVRCVILTGAGKAFCAGDDVNEAWEGDALEAAMEPFKRMMPKPAPEMAQVLEFEKPIIAAVNGIAVGSGLDFLLVADIRLANQYAKIGALYVNFNLSADFLAFRRLPQLVGPEKAAELLFTGDIIDADEALRIGLVSRVIEAKDLLDEAHSLAAKIASKPPEAVRYLKAGLAKGTHLTTGDLAGLSEFIGHSFLHLFSTDDHREAVKAFGEGRAPEFTGK